MLRLLGEVCAELGARGVSCALIGAGAMAAHGVSRSTSDLDLLATDRAVLEPPFWAALEARGVAVDVRRGDEDDPLAGVVRFASTGERPVDLVVGRPAWLRQALARAVPATLGAASVPVVTLPDLVLLKLYAGGPQDAWDVEQLLDAGERRATEAAVSARIGELPPEASRLWERIRQGRG